MNRRRGLILGWIIILALSSLLPLSALFHGIIHPGPAPYTADATLQRPVIAIGSDVRVPAGSRSVIVTLFGNVDAGGAISQDVVAIGGRVYLERGANVSGDVLALLGGIFRAPGVHVSGRLGGALHRWNGGGNPGAREYGLVVASAMRLGIAAGLALLLVGICLTVVFPWQIVLISSTLRASPLKSGAAGLLCLLTFVFLVIPLGLSLAGLPFAILLAGAGSLAWLFGLTAAAVVLGRLLARGTVSLLWATSAGLVVLTASMAVPILGPIVVVGIGLAGAGALAVALLSRSRPAVPVA